MTPTNSLYPRAINDKGLHLCKPLVLLLNLVRPERFERPTPWFVAG
jgi:hypothetical protein